MTLGTVLSAQALDPLSFPGCRVRLDAQGSATFTINAGRIERWANKAAVANDAEQVNTTSRPVLDGMGVNALPAVFFDGTSRSLVFQQNTRSTPGEYHCFVVARGVRSGQTFQQIVGSYSGSGTNFTALEVLSIAPPGSDGPIRIKSGRAHSGRPA